MMKNNYADIKKICSKQGCSKHSQFGLRKRQRESSNGGTIYENFYELRAPFNVSLGSFWALSLCSSCRKGMDGAAGGFAWAVLTVALMV